MYSTKVRAYAKINLTLEILGRAGGYHLLDSLVASVDVFDVIQLKKRKGKLSSVWMQGMGSESIPPEKNNALKAAERYSELFGTDGADIKILKNIPIGAGMGGSSADVAGVLNGMQKLYNAATQEELESLAESLGSDVKFMLKGGYARMEGKGEKLTYLEGIQRPLHFLMLMPSAGVSAGECYREYDRLNVTDAPSGATQNAINALIKGGEQTAKEVGRYVMNDLYEPAASLCAEVKTAMDDLQTFSPLGAFMTGSGSAVLALFETEELCRWAKSRYRGKCRASVLKTVDPMGTNPFNPLKKFWKSPFVLSETEK